MISRCTVRMWKKELYDIYSFRDLKNCNRFCNSGVFYIRLVDVTLPEDDLEKIETSWNRGALYAKVHFFYYLLIANHYFSYRRFPPVIFAKYLLPTCVSVRILFRKPFSRYQLNIMLHFFIFVVPCIAILCWRNPTRCNSIQIFTAKLLYMFRASIAPNIRST